MIKFIKKSFIILLLLTIKIIVLLTKSIYQFYLKNKSKLEKYSKSFYNCLKEELSR